MFGSICRRLACVSVWSANICVERLDCWSGVLASLCPRVVTERLQFPVRASAPDLTLSNFGIGVKYAKSKSRESEKVIKNSFSGFN